MNLLIANMKGRARIENVDTNMTLKQICDIYLDASGFGDGSHSPFWSMSGVPIMDDWRTLFSMTISEIKDKYFAGWHCNNIALYYMERHCSA